MFNFFTCGKTYPFKDSFISWCNCIWTGLISTQSGKTSHLFLSKMCVLLTNKTWWEGGNSDCIVINMKAQITMSDYQVEINYCLINCCIKMAFFLLIQWACFRGVCKLKKNGMEDN